jgi:hypothetical protein
MVNFPDRDYKALETQALAGDKAKSVKASPEWEWIKTTILGALHDQAVNTLKNAKSDEDRMKAQQMFLASDKPEDLIDFLISQGDAAVASLKELESTDSNPTLEGTFVPQEDQTYA